MGINRATRAKPAKVAKVTRQGGASQVFIRGLWTFSGLARRAKVANFVLK